MAGSPIAEGASRTQGCTCFRLRRATRRITQVYDAHLAAHQLTLSQYSLLANLARCAPPGILHLAEIMGMDRTTLTRNLKPLMARGLVALATGSDRRSKTVVLTEAGRAGWQAARPAWQAAQQELQARLGEDTVAALNTLLDQAFQGLGEETLRQDAPVNPLTPTLSP